MKEFFVVHLINKPDGTTSTPVSAYDTETEAWKNFYRLCGQAVDSVNYTDTLVLMNKRGLVLDAKPFEHMPEPEPEPNEEQ